jgi:hypothetical protein
MGTFDDPRVRQVDDLAFRAERAGKQGDERTARALYAEAAALEAELARAVPPDAPRVRGLLAVSAVARWVQAGCLDEAERLGRELVAAGSLTPDALAELAELLGPCRTERRTAAAVHVSLPSRTLNDEPAVRAWVSEVEAALLAKVKGGPVVV